MKNNEKHRQIIKKNGNNEHHLQNNERSTKNNEKLLENYENIINISMDFKKKNVYHVRNPGGILRPDTPKQFRDGILTLFI